MSIRCIAIGAVLVGVGYYAYKKGAFDKVKDALMRLKPG